MRLPVRLILRLTLLLALLTAAPALADDTDITPPGAPAAPDETHPTYSSDGRWIGSLLIATGGLFLAAVLIGRFIRTESPQTVPPASSHEEDPAADRVGHAESPEARHL
jgi:hypothetical protein